MATQGINIEFRNLTKGHHFDMVQKAIVEGGKFSNQSEEDKEEFYRGYSSYNLKRSKWRITYTVQLTYDVVNGKFIAECDYY